MTMTAHHHAPPDSRELSDAMNYCRQICRQRARNFYYGLKLSPEPQRTAVYVLYAWMRHADDLADSDLKNAPEQSRQRIEQFRSETQSAFNGNPPSGLPLWIALADTMDRFHLPHQHFHDMLDGQLADFTHKTYATFNALNKYCEHVASTVGLLCIEIWGYHDQRARDLAIDRGVAFQLTNILRDYAQDFDAGRVYLPEEDFERFHLTPERLRQWTDPDACRAMMLYQVERAERLYQRSSGLDEMITPACRPTLWAMTTIYHGLLSKVARNPEQVILGRRIRLSALHKAAIALRAKWGTLMHRAPSKPSAPLAPVAEPAHRNTIVP